MDTNTIAIRRNAEIPQQNFEKCHDGNGTLYCKSLLDGFGSGQFAIMHRDDMKAGVSIGEHEHTEREEIYYLLSGNGTLIFDGAAYEMAPGDISLCTKGHSHGFTARNDCVLIVVS